MSASTPRSARFSAKPLNAATVSGTTFELKNSAGILVSAAVAYNASNQTAVLTPNSPLSYATSYTATVKGGSSGVADAASNRMAADFVWTFTTAAAPGDTTPPTVDSSSIYPYNSSTGVSAGSSIRVPFSENMNPATITSSTVVLSVASGAVVPATVTYDPATFTATLDPVSPLAPGAAYTVTIAGVTDLAGNVIGSNYTLNFTTSVSSPYGSGPGGPILIVTSGSSPFSRYLMEILNAEGLNAYAVMDIGNVTAGVLASYDVAILGQMSLTSGQVTMFTTWVTGGGNLIAMRPDKQLAGLLGLTDAGTTLAEGYLLASTASGPGKGIVGQTIQYHGTADRYTLNGATSVATLYSNETTPTGNPAVTLRSMGANGGQAAAFTYDLARSIVYTRQGNPAWAGQERDGSAPMRSDDLFYPDWVNLDKAAIPQADEQQRLLANLIIQMNFDRKPLPRFWYFPDGLEAVVVMTGDDHGQDGTAGRFDQYASLSETGCTVDDWECIRGSSYIYPDPDGAVTDAEAVAYNAAGFEIGLHVNTGCADYTREELQDFFRDQTALFRSLFPSLPATVSHRAHCIAWSGYTTMAEVESDFGIRMDVNYYYWPGSWVTDRPGFFTGSGMPMRFATAAGEILDVYQAASQMTDESEQSYPFTIDALLDKAVGPEGYYGAFVANIHTDDSASWLSDAIVGSALDRGVPVLSAKQLLKWVDGRNGSSIGAFSSTASTLSFSVTVGQGANGLEVMVPKPSGKAVSGILRDGSAVVGIVSKMVKGIDYAVFSAVTGNYVVTFTGDTEPPTVFLKTPVDGAVDVAANTTVKATFSESMDPATIGVSTFELRGPAGALVPAAVTFESGTNTAVLTPAAALAAGTTYTAKVLGGSGGVKDAAGNAMTDSHTWSFTTAAATQSISIWNDSAVPSIIADPDSTARTLGIELGVKFQSAVSGYITGIRFYKGPTNLGMHTGSLWDSSGNRLATVTFTNETASGWQKVDFAAPVAIAANTTYVASYHAPQGNYSATSRYFASSAYENLPLRALANGFDGGNGLYEYGPSSFPRQTYNSENYWVDVVFQQSIGPDTTPPTITSVSPAAGASNVSTTATVNVTFSEAISAATVNSNFVLQATGTGAFVPATVGYNSATRTVTLTPDSALAAGVAYTATVYGEAGGVEDLAGNPLAADYTWSFTTAAGGTPQTYSVFGNTVPGTAAAADTGAVELGMKFRSTVSGYITAIRFYKGTGNGGAHIGNIWSSTGTNLARVNFSNETTTGWQQQTLASPVAVTAGTTYVVSYYAPQGRYAINTGYFSSGLTNGPLQALASSESGNGVYRYGSSTGFPSGTWNASNYWVDVVFQE